MEGQINEGTMTVHEYRTRLHKTVEDSGSIRALPVIISVVWILTHLAHGPLRQEGCRKINNDAMPLTRPTASLALAAVVTCC